VRGALHPAGGEVLPQSGSDHRPVRADLEVGQVRRPLDASVEPG